MLRKEENYCAFQVFSFVIHSFDIQLKKILSEVFLNNMYARESLSNIAKIRKIDSGKGLSSGKKDKTNL